MRMYVCMYVCNLMLNKLQQLICHKTLPTNHQLKKQPIFSKKLRKGGKILSWHRHLLLYIMEKNIL